MDDEGTIEVVEERVKPTVIRRRKRVTEAEPTPEEQAAAEAQEAVESVEEEPAATEVAPEGPPPALRSPRARPPKGKNPASPRYPRKKQNPPGW